MKNECGRGIQPGDAPRGLELKFLKPEEKSEEGASLEVVAQLQSGSQGEWKLEVSGCGGLGECSVSGFR
jgi:hypothetical protein